MRYQVAKLQQTNRALEATIAEWKARATILAVSLELAHKALIDVHGCDECPEDYCPICDLIHQAKEKLTA